MCSYGLAASDTKQGCKHPQIRSKKEKDRERIERERERERGEKEREREREREREGGHEIMTRRGGQENVDKKRLPFVLLHKSEQL